MKKLIFCLLAMLSVLTVSAQEIYEFNVINDRGEEIPMAEYKDKVILIVNTATKCGFTPQYKELETLYEKYEEKGFVILDFPCNQFGEQAPGSIEEIHQFCTDNFNIKFPQFEKIEVNGKNEHPLYTFLKKQMPFEGFDIKDKMGAMLDKMMREKDTNYDNNPDIKWNFTKFLISRDGKVLRRFEPTATFEEIEKAIMESF